MLTLLIHLGYLGYNSKEQEVFIPNQEIFIPRREFGDKPAIILELKWNESADTAISQIKNKQYCSALEEYQGNLLLVGVCYNKKTKEHICKIEKYDWKGAKNG